MTTKLDVYQIITDRILDLLEKGVVPWHKPWSTASSGVGPTNFVSKRPYRGMNVFMLSCMPFTCPYWVSFKQAQELGGSVRKGERGTPVVFWQRIAGKRREDDKDEKPNTYMLLRYYTVFNLQQTEGIEWEQPKPTRPDYGDIAAAKRIVDEMPQRPTIRHGGSSAYYAPAPDVVVMPDAQAFDTQEHYYSTLFHELVHATGHQKRLNRKGISLEISADRSFGAKDYGREELVAEMGSAFLCGAAGIANASIDQSAAYIKGWMTKIKEDSKCVVLAAAQAQKAADFILGIKFETEE